MKKVLSLIVILAAFTTAANSQTYAPLYGTRLELKNGSNKTTIYPPSSGGFVSLFLPVDAPNDGDMLVTTSGGILSWEPVPAGTGGTVTSVDGAGMNGLTLTGGPITTTGTLTVGITANGIGYGSIQQVGAGRLLGNSTGAGATIEEISVGSGLTLSGGILSATAGGVTSVQGTTDQVLVNGSDNTQETGDVVLSLPQSIGTSSSPQFTGLNVSGLTPSTLVAVNASGDLVSYVAAAATLSGFGSALGGQLGVNNGGTGLQTSDLSGQAGKAIIVNPGENGYTFAALGGTGTVTSVAIAGNNGISIVSGSPITTSGTITLGLGAITPTSVASTGTVTGTNLSGTNTGDVTLAGQNYLSIASQVITANAVNLSGTHVTGTLAAARFPALTGDVTTTSGSLATTIANDAVTTAKILNSNVTLAKISNAAANSKLLGSGASGSGAAYTEITLGTGLSMTGTTLSATGGGGGTVYLTWSGNTRANNWSTSATQYSSLNGSQNPTTAQADHEFIVPVSCTITAIYVIIGTATGNTDDWDFDVVNVTAGTSSNNVTFTGATTTNSITGQSFAVTAGDRVVFRCTPNSGPTASTSQWGILATVP